MEEEPRPLWACGMGRSQRSLSGEGEGDVGVGVFIELRIKRAAGGVMGGGG